MQFIYEKILNNYILIELMKALIVVLIIIVLAVNIGTYIYKSSIHTFYTTNGLIVDLQDTIKKDLNKITDVESLKEQGNIVGVTNNNDTSNYRLLLCGRQSPKIRLNINNASIKNLSSFSYENGCYIIIDKEIIKQSTDTYELKLFIPKSVSMTDYYANYKIKVEGYFLNN
ncbi:unknown [Mycoplasma sp. CAG:956]|nr:hypothetical protein [Bacilli bacterium]CCY88819.1 unknown [Mycoplasma sp. CAG:956]